jgi:hypothetical protein
MYALQQYGASIASDLSTDSITSSPSAAGIDPWKQADANTHEVTKRAKVLETDI